MEKDALNADKVNVVCSAGVQNNDTVEFCALNGLSGMESFALRCIATYLAWYLVELLLL